MADYMAHHLVPALDRSPNPVSLVINYGHVVVPENVAGWSADDNGRGGCHSIMYNAPGSTMTVVPTGDSSPPKHNRVHFASEVLRTCRGCGSLRVVISGGYCRDCDAAFGGRRRQPAGLLM